MPRTPTKRFFGALLLMGALFLAAPAALAQSGVQEYRFDLVTSGAVCDASNATTSCVRYNGDSAFYSPGDRFFFTVDFDAQVGDEVPLTIEGLYFPDVVQAFDTIFIDATGEISGPLPTGVWNLSTGFVEIFTGPVDFPNVVLGGTTVDPMPLEAQLLSGSTSCGSGDIPPMLGVPLAGPTSAPGEMTVVGRSCVIGPSLNETFFAILRGTLMPVPEPGSLPAAAAAMLSLALLGRRKGVQ